MGDHEALWIDNGASTHRGYCEMCKETVTELHSPYWDGDECTRCGRTDPITNIID